MDHATWCTKWREVPDPLDDEPLVSQTPGGSEADFSAPAAWLRSAEEPVDQLRALKVALAVEAYDRRRPRDVVMHHYWIKDAGDAEAVGEYFPTGDHRNDAPVYRNSRGLILSREKQPASQDSKEECYGWVLGNVVERRPLYGVESDDLSVPVVGWQSFTAPEPLPLIRYYTNASAARVFKEKGNRAFQQREWSEAHRWYTKSLEECSLDPAMFPDAVSMLRSNRAEVRLRLVDFDGAATDAGAALKHLKDAVGPPESLTSLRLKTVVRLAKALRGSARFPEALRLLQEQAPAFPGSGEMRRLLEEARVAAWAESGASPALAAGGSEELLAYVAKVLGDLQAQAACRPVALSERLGVDLGRLEYALAKAHSMEGPCLSSLQMLVRSRGGITALLAVIRAQWRGVADSSRAPLAVRAAIALSYACDRNAESSCAVACEAHRLFGILGGCSCKMEAGDCRRLISLIGSVWEHSRRQTAEALQAQSHAVEGAASFLAQAALSECRDGGAPSRDAPVLERPWREEPIALLTSLLTHGGRIEKRALRGVAKHIVGDDGEGFLTSGLPSVCSCGELLACKVEEDLSVLPSDSARSLSRGVYSLLSSGPWAALGQQPELVVPFEAQEVSAERRAMRFVDLEAWAEEDAGRRASTLLRLLSRSLEHRLLRCGEVEREACADAFREGGGYPVTIPLLQAPLALAEPAVRCLSALAQAVPSSVVRIIGLGGLRPLLAPEGPEGVLARSAPARSCAAKLLSRCIDERGAQDLIENIGEGALRRVMQLALMLHKDGRAGLEAFHDMVHILFVLSSCHLALLCCVIPSELLRILAEVSLSRQRNEVVERAEHIVQRLMGDRSCRRVLRPMLRSSDEARYDVEDELLQTAARAARLPLVASA